MDVSFWPCVPEPPGGVVPIGRPIANHRLHVVDRFLGAQPIGVPGELLLGGPGLARGYLGRPDLTAAAFVPDPFGIEPSGRLYRTGDLTRLLPDGNVEYLGRLDHQVKVRGFRIELGEIEATLVRQRGVREAVVLVREDAPGDKRLVAYLVGSAPADLAERLRRVLPDYMVPADFVLLESLPLTANGKADRRALSRLAPVAVREVVAYTAPQGPVEETVAAIFAEVLGGWTGGAGGSPRRLLRPRRPFAPGDPGDLPPARCLRNGDAGPCALRGADRGGNGGTRRPRRSGGARARNAAHRAGAADGTAAALLRPAAALVPGSAGAGQPGLQHSGGGGSWRGGWTSRCSPAPSPRWYGGTRRYARRSRRRPAGRSRSSPRAPGEPRPCVDRSGRPAEAERRQEADRLAIEEARRPFDLNAGAAAAGGAAEAGGRATPDPGDPASHRQRRLVHRRAGGRAGEPVRGLSGGPAQPAAGARRCSTPTLPCGSAGVSRGSCWPRSWPGGAASSPECRRPWICPRITRALRRPACRERSSISRSMASASPGSRRSPSGMARRCS